MCIQRFFGIFLSGIIFSACSLSEDRPRFNIDSVQVESTLTPADHGEATPNSETTPQEAEEISPVPSTPVPEVEDSTPTPSEEGDEEWSDKECPPEWFLIPSGMYNVGAPPEVYSQTDDRGYSVSRVPLYEVVVEESFCISPFPYPGKEGEWPEGLNLTGAETLDGQLSDFGIRIVSGSEYLAAVSGSSNDRWAHGSESWEASHCDGDPNNPSNIGVFPECQSSFGPEALLTFAFWARGDEAFASATGWSTVNAYVVVGGMPSSWDAFYGDDLWGSHQHGSDEEAYSDDKPGFLVSDPWSVGEDDWEEFQVFVSDGSERSMKKKNTQRRHPTFSEFFQRH